MNREPLASAAMGGLSGCILSIVLHYYRVREYIEGSEYRDLLFSESLNLYMIRWILIGAMLGILIDYRYPGKLSGLLSHKIVLFILVFFVFVFAA